MRYARIFPPFPSRNLTQDQSVNLLTDHPTVRPTTAMPPLLQRLTERKPENLDYLGVSYGLTSQLLRSVLLAFFCAPTLSYITSRFWKRAGYAPLYIRQTQSELTGEHTIVMVRGLQSSTVEELGWLGEFSKGGFAPRLFTLD